MVVNILDNNVDLVKNASDAAIKRALTIIGLDCENYAKANAPVDTGVYETALLPLCLMAKTLWKSVAI